MLKKAQQLAESGDIEGAWEVLKELLYDEPTNPHYLLAATFCMQKVSNWPVAYHLANANILYMPDRPEPYINLANACDELYRIDEGVEACKHAIEIAIRIQNGVW